MPRPLFKDPRASGTENSLLGRSRSAEPPRSACRPTRAANGSWKPSGGISKAAAAKSTNGATSVKHAHRSSESASSAADPSTTALESGLPWPIKHAPRTLEEVALHPSKLHEIYTALDPGSATRVLVLSGPSGSSKSTAIRLAAERRAQQIIEFHTPEAAVGSTSLVNSFREFLVGAAMHDRNTTVVLVEELPSIFHEDTREAFESALMSWAAEPNQPVVAVSFTEIEVSAKYSEALVVGRVLGRLVTEQRSVVWLKTNPINATLLQRLLKRVAQVENLQLPASALKSLAGCGDARSALNALELSCRAPGTASADLWVRGTPVELFHAVGKVVWTSSKQGSLEEALGMFEDSMEMFCLTVLENYTSAKHERLPVSSAGAVTEWLSLADMGSQDSGLLQRGNQASIGTIQSTQALGMLGAANAIACSEPRLDLPKRFVQTRFTQFPKWRAERNAEEARVQRMLRNLRASQPTTKQALVLDERAFASHFPQPKTPDLLEDDEDDEDDF